MPNPAAPAGADWCEAAVPTAPLGTGPGWAECGDPATAVHLYRCVHGHERRRRTCPRHAPEPGAVGCRTCFEQGHECPMTAREAT